MNKTEAMEFLGVSKRTLEKYQGNGRLPFAYITGKTGEVVDFDPADVARLKNELTNESRGARRATVVSSAESASPESNVTGATHTSIAKSAVRARDASSANDSSSASHATTLAKVARSEVLGQGSAAEFAELLSESFEKALKSSVIDLKAKATLSFPEAQIVTGVPERQLREAAKAGQIKEVKIGRTLRIRTSDAISYAESLFN